MSSNFLNKSGLSYFYGKIKEMLQNKQDKLTPGTGITIQNNVISATGGSNKQNLYVYDIEQRILKTAGPFFFEMERCIPTAAVSTSVINRL